MKFDDNGRIICEDHNTEKDRVEVDKLNRYLDRSMTGAELREFAGLSVGQAAKLSGISREAIAADES